MSFLDNVLASAMDPDAKLKKRMGAAVVAEAEASSRMTRIGTIKACAKAQKDPDVDGNSVAQKGLALIMEESAAAPQY